MKKAYISCPLNEGLYKIREVAVKLHELGYKAEAYIRGTIYSDQKLRDADIFVLIPSGNLAGCPHNEMTEGCRKELMLARNLNKKLYMAIEYPDSVFKIRKIDLDLLREGNVSATHFLLQPIQGSVIINDYEIY